ncbi:MAG: hypothetical protein CM1200mP16_12360 [Nitrospina sp.]|nr:MAG: hypothetical protein CM1200mP16_12360 [Nitrospina sp.]
MPGPQVSELIIWCLPFKKVALILSHILILGKTLLLIVI